MLTDQVEHVLGVDPDRDRITIAIVTAATQGAVADAVFPATPSGYQAALRWANKLSAANNRAWSIEGSGSYGAGLTSVLSSRGEFVIEFDHPTGRASKDGAKSDTLDAYRAAREALGRTSWSTPRARGAREGLRALIAARDSAKTSRTSAINVLKALVLTSPPNLRHSLSTLTLARLLDACLRLRPRSTEDPELAATKLALRSTAARVKTLNSEMTELEQAMRPLVHQLAPRLIDEPGIATLLAAHVIVSWSHAGRCRSEAAFARLAGGAPLEATSGQTQTRHRLSRGGDRDLNRALHQAVVVRAKCHPPTKAYIARRVSEGKTKKEAIRCAKRYLARHLFRVMENTAATT